MGETVFGLAVAALIIVCIGGLIRAFFPVLDNQPTAEELLPPAEPGWDADIDKEGLNPPGPTYL